MTSEKKASAKQDLFAFYVGRPISYWATLPFLNSKLKPDQVSMLSFLPTIFGFVVCCFATNLISGVIGWTLFFLWNIMDGIDGNMARYRREFSSRGSVLDASSGYLVMVLFFFGTGIMASNPKFQLLSILPYWYARLCIVLGGLSGISVIFPRLVMHKALSEAKAKTSAISLVKDKEHFGLGRLVALNLTSISGFVQPIMLIALLTHMLDIFTFGYFIINVLVMLVSLKTIYYD